MSEPKEMAITKITVKYSIIEISEIPKLDRDRRPTGFWPTLFRSIPEGKAAAIPRTEKLPKTVYSSFAQWKASILRKGMPFHYKFRTDKKNIYIIHEKS